MSNATIDIPKDILEPIIQARVSAVLTEAFGDKGAIIDRIVSATLRMKVDSEGKPDRYESSGSKTLIEYLAADCIKNAVRSALQEAMSAHKEQLRDAIVKELRNTKSKAVASLVESMITGLGKATTDKYRLSISYGEKEV